MTRRLLILGGTGEARRIADEAARLSGVEVLSSLAGRTRDPRTPAAGRTRRGGFGGAAGLEDCLVREGIGLVVDATHPYAATMSRHAATACDRLGLPRLLVLRPPWTPGPGDTWIPVQDMSTAAQAVGDHPGTVFLTIGRQELDAFRHRPERAYLIRLVETPDHPLPLPEHRLVIGRGPFTVEGEAALMRAHGVGVVVSRNAGGAEGTAKLAAARTLGLPVMMVDRPPLPAGDRVADAAAALAWLRRHLDAPEPRA